jgi:hypothetical protein
MSASLYYLLIRTESADAINIVLFVVSLLALLLALIIHFLGRFFIGQSVYTENYATFSVSAAVPGLETVTTALVFLLDTFFAVYPMWSQFVSRGLHIALMIASFVFLIRYPRVSPVATGISLATCATALFATVVRMVSMANASFVDRTFFFLESSPVSLSSPFSAGRCASAGGTKSGARSRTTGL